MGSGRTGQRGMLGQLPTRARRYVLGVDALAVGCLAVLAATTSWRCGDIVTAAVLVACGVLSVEVFRRIGAPLRRVDRPYHDLIGVFLFPAALMLPPVYAALMPLVLHALLQATVARLPAVKRVFNTAATVLYCAGAALVHDAFSVPLAHNPSSHIFASLTAIVAVFAAAFAFIALNKIAVVGIIRRVSPAAPWRTLLCDTESWTLSAGEVSAGVVVALVWLASPALVVFAVVPVLLLQRAVVHTHLVAASHHDAKTGLANPSWWRHEAGRAVTRARHDGGSVAVAVIDLDHFKVVNDRHGHLSGDAVLAAVADTLRVTVRPGDLVGRFGGDEFTVLLSGVNPAQARATAERLRDRLAATIAHALRDDRISTPVTASVGVAAFGPSGIDLDGLLDAADRAMYRAKAAGGNRVCAADNAPSPLPAHHQTL